MIGGKLASYRLFSEEMTDVLAKRLGNDQPCRSHTSPLPGGDEAVDPMQLVLDGGMEAVTATRLEYRHGARSLRVLERMQRNPREAAVVCPCEPVTEAEIRYVVEHELRPPSTTYRAAPGSVWARAEGCAARCAAAGSWPTRGPVTGAGHEAVAVVLERRSPPTAARAEPRSGAAGGSLARQLAGRARSGQRASNQR